jgi:hypothetical protein
VYTTINTLQEVKKMENIIDNIKALVILGLELVILGLLLRVGIVLLSVMP